MRLQRERERESFWILNSQNKGTENNLIEKICDIYQIKLKLERDKIASKSVFFSL